MPETKAFLACSIFKAGFAFFFLEAAARRFHVNEKKSCWEKNPLELSPLCATILYSPKRTLSSRSNIIVAPFSANNGRIRKAEYLGHISFACHVYNWAITTVLAVKFNVSEWSKGIIKSLQKKEQLLPDFPLR